MLRRWRKKGGTDLAITLLLYDVQGAKSWLAPFDVNLTFRRLSDAVVDAERDREVRDLFVDPTAFDEWAERWRSRLSDEAGYGSERRSAMRAINPAYIPRNYQVEEVIRAAIEDKNFGPLERLGTVWANPYEDQPAFAAFEELPAFDTSTYRTFCGT